MENLGDNFAPLPRRIAAVPFRGRSRYPPLRKDTQRDSGAFERVSCGEHQSRSVKHPENSSHCTRNVQKVWTSSAAAFECTQLSDETAPLSRAGRNARAEDCGRSLVIARAIAERMSGRMNPEDERALDRTALESVLSLRRSKERKER